MTVNGTLCQIEGFEAGHQNTIDDGTMTVSSTWSRTGTYSGVSTVAGKESGAFFFVNADGENTGQTAVSSSFAFRITTMPTAGGFGTRWGLASYTGALTIPEVAVDTDDKLCIITGPNEGGSEYGTDHWRGTHTITTGVDYILHMQQYKAALSGASSNWPIRVKLYDSSLVLLDDSGWQNPIYTSSSATTISAITVGQYSLPTTGGLMYFDDIVSVRGGVGAPVGPKVMALFPTGDSAAQAFATAATIDANMTDVQTTLSYSAGGTDPFFIGQIIQIGAELIRVVTIDAANDDLTSIVRGVFGTAGAAHTSGDAILNYENTWTEVGDGDGVKWDEVGEAPPDDANYIDTPNSQGANKAQMFTHSAMATIDGGVTSTTPVYGLRMRARSVRVAGLRLLQYRFRNEGLQWTNSATLVPPSGTPNYDTQRLMGREPIPTVAGGAIGNLPAYVADWTVAKVDNSEFGVMVGTDSPTNDDRVHQMYVEVAYGGVEWVDDRMGRVAWTSFNNATGGTVSVPSTTTLKDSAQSWHPNILTGATITIDSGTGSGQSRHITANTADTVTISAAWTTNPDSTSKYSITMTGTATSGAAGSLTNTSKAWRLGQLQGQRLRITGGTGASETVTNRPEGGSVSQPQERTITGNTATVISVAPDWATNPDNTSTYEILGPEGGFDV